MDNIFLLIQAGLNTLALLTSNPALGGGSSVQSAEITKLLVLFSSLVARGEDAAHELEVFTKKIEELVAEGREPTPAEWAALEKRSDTAHEALQEAKKRIETEPQPLSDQEKAELHTLLEMRDDLDVNLTPEQEERMAELLERLEQTPE